MAKKPEKTSEKSQKSLYLPNVLWDRIDKAAKKERRSINTFLELKLEKEQLKNLRNERQQRK